MVLILNESVLETAIEAEARSNAGFLYIRAGESIEHIKNQYSGHDETGLPTKYKGSVDKDTIQSKLESMAEGSEVEMIRDDTVYFLNPFKLPGEASQELYNTVKNVFDDKRYFTRQDLVEYLREANIHIAEDDVEAFIGEFRQRDLLKKLEGQTTYYRPGSELRENTDLKSRSEIIESGANDDGCLTHAELEEILEIDTITEEIKDDLTSDDVIHEVDNKYLVGSENAYDDYVDYFTEKKLKRPIYESFKSSDWVKTEDEFESDLRTQIKKKSEVLSVLEDEDLFYDLKDDIIEKVQIEMEKTEIDGQHTSVFKIQADLQELINEEASAIENEIEKTVNNDDPLGMDAAIQKADVPMYGSNDITNSYIRQKVLEQARAKIHENDEINIWTTIEG